MNFEIDIAVECDSVKSPGQLQSALHAALQHGLHAESVAGAVLSVTVVDDRTMHHLNRAHLNHDYTTDVISFPLEWSGPAEQPPTTDSDRAKDAIVEGEIVVNADYAARMAVEVGWDVVSELTLYAVHGMLHICGYDDLTPSEKDIMRSREAAVLNGLGLSARYPHDNSDRSEGLPTSIGTTETEAPE